MVSQPPSRGALISTIAGLLVIALAALGCGLGSSGGTGGGGGTTGGTGTPAASQTPTGPHYALAWVQIDGGGIGQIWASINGGAAQQVTHRSGVNACGRNPDWSPPVYSPDLHHIVIAFADTSNCDQGPQAGQLFVVDATTGSLTAVNSSGIETDVREEGWIDSNTIWWIDSTGAHQQPLGGSATSIASIPTNVVGGSLAAPDAVVRGHTLFYVTKTIPSSGPITYALKRYDLSSNSALSGSVNLGSSCNCGSDNIVGSPGFDVSPDGSHLVFQRVAPGGSGSATGVGSSIFYYANADGSAPTQIASYTTAASFTYMQISPNGELVAVTNAQPSPTIFSASVSSAGQKTDPNLHFYQDAASFPAWDMDNAHFSVSTTNLIHYAVGTPTGTVTVSGASCPWLTIGS